MVVVLADMLSNPSSVNAHEIKRIVEIAQMFGCRSYPIPSDLGNYEHVDDVFTYVPTFDTITPGIWVGVIPQIERYESIYNAALKRNIQLVNTPAQHRKAMEFDQFYPFIEDLTPKSLIITSPSDLSSVIEHLSFPVFVKGAVKSNKDEGWSAVVANDVSQLDNLVERSLLSNQRSRGKVIVRELVQLNTIATDPNGFPIGREYRAFMYRGEILAYGFYWEEYEDPQPLAGEDLRAFQSSLHQVSEKVDVPFLSIDIGQLANGDWIIIEIGDGQFSGLSHISSFRTVEQA